MTRRWIWVLIVAVLVGVLALAVRIAPGGTAVLKDSDNRMRLIYLFVVLAAVSTGIAARLQAKPGSTLAQFGVWILVFAGLILVYSFRSDFTDLKDRFMAELVPGRGRAIGPREIAFPLDADGQYHVYAEADGAMLPFIIDTGATDVVLSPDAARQLGLDPANLQYTVIANTANGQVRGAPVLIDTFKLGPIFIQSLPATVNEAEMPFSLLGMEFLSRLKSWHVEDGRLTLRQ